MPHTKKKAGNLCSKGMLITDYVEAMEKSFQYLALSNSVAVARFYHWQRMPTRRGCPSTTQAPTIWIRYGIMYGSVTLHRLELGFCLEMSRLVSHYDANAAVPTQLLQAKHVFSQHARGPACERYLQQLEEDCEKVWRNGRQLCEHISLTGNHCVHEVVQGPGFNYAGL